MNSFLKISIYIWFALVYFLLAPTSIKGQKVIKTPDDITFCQSIGADASEVILSPLIIAEEHPNDFPIGKITLILEIQERSCPPPPPCSGPNPCPRPPVVSNLEFPQLDSERCYLKIKENCVTQVASDIDPDSLNVSLNNLNKLEIEFLITDTLTTDTISLFDIPIQYNNLNLDHCGTVILTTSPDSILAKQNISEIKVAGTIPDLRITGPEAPCLGQPYDYSVDIESPNSYTYIWENQRGDTLCTTRDCEGIRAFSGDEFIVTATGMNGCSGIGRKTFDIDDETLLPTPNIFFKQNYESLCDIIQNNSINLTDPSVIDFSLGNSQDIEIFTFENGNENLLPNKELTSAYCRGNFPTIVARLSEGQCTSTDTLKEKSLLNYPDYLSSVCQNTELSYQIDTRDAICKFARNPLFGYFYFSVFSFNSFFSTTTCPILDSSFIERFHLSILPLDEASCFGDSSWVEISKVDSFLYSCNPSSLEAGDYKLVLIYQDTTLNRCLELDQISFSVVTSDVTAEIDWQGLCDGQKLEFSDASDQANFPNRDVNYKSTWSIFLENSSDTLTKETFPLKNTEWTPQKSLPPGEYEVHLNITEASNRICVEPTSRKFYRQPILTPHALQPYIETFKTDKEFLLGQNSWVADAPSGIYSWIFPDVSANPPRPYWRSENLLAREQSILVGPCLDLAQLSLPKLSLKIQGWLNEGTDGLAVQIAPLLPDSPELFWKTLGSQRGVGINWYNEDKIDGAPGDDGISQNGNENPNRVGWSGRFSPGDQWMDVSHRLDTYTGDTIALRLALGSSLTNLENFYVKFDSVFIGERTKKIVFEYFNDDRSPLSRFNDVYDHWDKFEQELYSLQIPAADINPIIYEYNPDIFESRSLFYRNSIVDANHIVLDGLSTRDIFLKNNPFLNEIDQDFSIKNVLNLRSLELPTLDINKLTFNTVNRSVSFDLIANKRIATEISIFFALVAQRWLDTDTTFLPNVLITYLPNTGGIYRNIDWEIGNSLSEDIELTFPRLEGPIDSVELIVLIQDIYTKEIYQSHGIGKFSKEYFQERIAAPPNIKTDIPNLTIYPNPTTDKLIIEWDQFSDKSINWEIFDLAGRTISSGLQVEPHEQFIINTSSLSPGLYPTCTRWGRFYL